jgi:hypothetical protein
MLEMKNRLRPKAQFLREFVGRGIVSSNISNSHFALKPGIRNLINARIWSDIQLFSLITSIYDVIDMNSTTAYK